MTPQREIDLKIIIEREGEITVDIVPDNGDSPYQKTFTNPDEAVSEVLGYENENEVYF